MRLIDADALLEQIENPYQWREVARWVNDAPTIEPEQKHGRWVEEHVGNGWNEIWNYTCSECGKTINDFYKANYCPNCGCAMTKDGDS